MIRLGRDPYLPAFPVRLPIPDLRPWLEGNRLPGVWSFDGPLPGPHVALVSLIHGNEIAGALLLARWLREGLRPLRGRLTFIFGNLAAFARFDPADPTVSRFVDEDLNRVWDDRMLAGTRRSTELERARALRPLMDEVDVLLDLHSMLWPSDPLIIAGQAPESRALGLRLGTPSLVVADHGHQTGRRLIDSPAFAARPALLVEGGPHWEETTLETLERSATTLLQEYGLVPPARTPAPPGRLAEVTRTVIAGTHAFTFVEQFRGGTVIPRRNTLLALDGDQEIRTPHDDCLLIMPSPRALRGHTAIRLARYV